MCKGFEHSNIMQSLEYECINLPPTCIHAHTHTHTHTHTPHTTHHTHSHTHTQGLIIIGIVQYLNFFDTEFELKLTCILLWLIFIWIQCCCLLFVPSPLSPFYRFWICYFCNLSVFNLLIEYSGNHFIRLVTFPQFIPQKITDIAQCWWCHF
jgi:hypothetical protein